MLVRLALVPTAEALDPTVAREAAGLVEEENREDTKSPGHHLYA